jgi:hypothetical protein
MRETRTPDPARLRPSRPEVHYAVRGCSDFLWRRGNDKRARMSSHLLARSLPEREAKSGRWRRVGCHRPSCPHNPLGCVDVGAAGLLPQAEADHERGGLPGVCVQPVNQLEVTEERPQVVRQRVPDDADQVVPLAWPPAASFRADPAPVGPSARTIPPSAVASRETQPWRNRWRCARRARADRWGSRRPAAPRRRSRQPASAPARRTTRTNRIARSASWRDPVRGLASAMREPERGMAGARHRVVTARARPPHST